MPRGPFRRPSSRDMKRTRPAAPPGRAARLGAGTERRRKRVKGSTRSVIRGIKRADGQTDRQAETFG